MKPNQFFSALLIPVLTATAGCHRKDSSSRTSEIQTVRVAHVALSGPTRGTVYSAELTANATVQLMFKSPGIVSYVRPAAGGSRLITIGDTIRAGEMLAQVQPREWADRVVQAHASLKQAEQSVLTAEANNLAAERQFARTSTLYQQEAATQPMFDRTKADVESTRALVKQSHDGVVQAQQTLDQAQSQLHDTGIYAPFTGFVQSRNVDPGQLVGNSTPALTVVDLHRVKAIFSVPQTALADVRNGQEIPMALDSGIAVGHVTGITPAADQEGHLFNVEVTLENQSGALRPGAIGSLRLSRQAMPLPAQLTVPLVAIIKADKSSGGFSVFVIGREGDHDVAHLRPIQIGDYLGDQVQVRSGLSNGEAVITQGSELLHDRQPVRVIP